MVLHVMTNHVKCFLSHRKDESTDPKLLCKLTLCTYTSQTSSISDMLIYRFSLIIPLGYYYFHT